MQNNDGDDDDSNNKRQGRSEQHYKATLPN